MIQVESGPIHLHIIWAHTEEGRDDPEEEPVRTIPAEFVPRVGEELWLIGPGGSTPVSSDYQFAWRVVRIAYWIPPEDHPYTANSVAVYVKPENLTR